MKIFLPPKMNLQAFKKITQTSHLISLKNIENLQSNFWNKEKNNITENAQQALKNLSLEAKTKLLFVGSGSINNNQKREIHC